MAGGLAAERLKQMENRDRMSALDVALLGKSLTEGEDSIRNIAIEEDEDWQLLKNQAKSGGVGSWFASKVDFTLNGTRFLGKIGYSVKGGVVPLFDGAAVDLKPSALIGQDPKKQSGKKKKPDEPAAPAGAKNIAQGMGGMLVLAPMKAANAAVMRMDQIVVTEKGLVGSAKKKMSFRLADGTRVQAGRIEISDQIAVIYDVSVEENGEEKLEKYRTEAIITDQGIGLFPNPAASLQETAGDKPQPEGSTEEGQTDQGTQSGTGQETAEAQELPPMEHRQGIGYRAVNEAVSRLPENITTESFSMDNSGNIQLGTGIDIAEGGDEDSTFGEFAKETVMDAVQEAGLGFLTDILKDPKGTIEEKVTVFKRIIEEFQSEEIREAWKDLPGNLKDGLLNGMEEDELEDLLSSLMPSEDIKAFLFGEDEEEEEEEEGVGTVPLAKIPIFPPIYFTVEFRPEYKFAFHAGLKTHNALALLRAMEDPAAKIKMTAGITGTLSLTLAAGVEADLLLLSLFGGLTAFAKLKGAAPGQKATAQEKYLASADLDVSILRNANGTYQLGDMAAGLNAGFDLTGGFGATMDIRSKLIGWTHNLASVTFKEWNIARVEASLRASRKSSPAPVWKGWKFDEATVSAEAFGGAFTASNTKENKYNLYKEMEVESDYENIDKDFNALLDLLEQFRGGQPKENEDGLVVGKDAAGDIASNVETLRDAEGQLIEIWYRAQMELQSQLIQLDLLENSSGYQKDIESTRKSIEKHSRRLNDLLKSREKDPTFKNVKQTRGFKKWKAEAAAEKAYSYENLVEYERNRYQELTENTQARIDLITGLKEQGKTDEEITRQYKDKKGKAYDHLEWFSSVAELLQYEQSRLDEYTDDRLQKWHYTKTESRKDKGTGNTQITQSFDYRKYYKDNEDKSEKLLKQIGSLELLLQYERGKAEPAAKSSAAAPSSMEKLDDYALLKLLKNGDGNALTEAKRRIADSEEKYMAATLEDMLAFEVEKNAGSEGQAVKAYLERDERFRSVGSEPVDELKAAFKEEKGAALERFSDWLSDHSEEESLIPYITVENVIDFVRQGERDEGIKQKKILYLESIQGILRSVEGDQIREKETQYLSQYFKRFGRDMRKYQTALSKGRSANLAMMEAAFYDESASPILQALREVKPGSLSAYELMEFYENNGGNRQELSGYMAQKAEFTAAELQQFYRLRTENAGRGIRKSRTAGHKERYLMLQEMKEDGKSYEEILEKYQSMGAGNGYLDFIKSGLRKGSLNGIPITPDQILQAELSYDTEEQKKHKERIAFLQNAQTSGRDYHEVYTEYAKTFSASGFQDYLKKKMKGRTLTSGQLLEYEAYRLREKGGPHENRLRNLLNLKPEETLDSEGHVEKEDQAKKAEEYRRIAKAYKRDEKISAIKEAEENQLDQLQGPQLGDTMIRYEEGRRAFYEARLNELAGKRSSIEEVIANLDQKINASRKISQNLYEIQKKPESVFKAIDEYKAGVEEARKKKEEETKAAEESRKWREEIRAYIDGMQKQRP